MHSAFNAINLIAKYHVGDDGHDLSISLPYLTGFLVVIVTLAALMGLCMGVGVLVQRFGPKEAEPKHTTRKKIAPAAAEGEISPEILAVLSAAVASMNDQTSDQIFTVISAAVATMIDAPHKVISIKPHANTWSQAGRQQIQSSHNLR